MTGQDAIALVDTLLHAANQGQRLTDVQSVVFLETWTGTSYREIAKQSGYEYDFRGHKRQINRYPNETVALKTMFISPR